MLQILALTSKCGQFREDCGLTMAAPGPGPALQFQLHRCNLECLGGFLTGQVWEATQLHREGEFAFPGRLGLLQPPG